MSPERMIVFLAADIFRSDGDVSRYGKSRPPRCVGPLEEFVKVDELRPPAMLKLDVQVLNMRR